MLMLTGGAVWILLCVCGVYGQTDDVAENVYPPLVTGDYIPQKCWNFSYGNRIQKEFYSPSYPNNYSNRTECTQILTAPEDHIIELDFRDEFHIEFSEDKLCGYDYLEIRDGPFGYSPLIGKFCGRTFPPLIISSSRYLWIRFKSDESIEYKGFRAVYKFLPDTNLDSGSSNYTVCLINVNSSSYDGYISSDDIPDKVKRRAQYLNSPIDCTWVILAPKGHRVYIPALREFEFKMSTPGDCTDSFIEMYDRTTAEAAAQKKFCSTKTIAISSGSNRLMWRVYADNFKLLPSFKALYTFFSKEREDGTCSPNAFHCEKDFCISYSLLCNKRKNCDNNNDESKCVKPTEESSTTAAPAKLQYHTVILGIVGGLIITVIVISICITCQQRQREERRRQHAMRQERHTIEMTASLLNRTPQSSRHSEPDASPRMNHVAVSNRIPNSTSHNGKHPPVHNQLNGGRNAPNRHFQRKLSDFETEVSGDGTIDGSGTFRRFLDVDNYSDDYSSTNPSMGNQISTVVTVEHTGHGRRLSSEGACARDKSPSPRPDIVQEERFTYPDPVTEPKRDRFTTGRQSDKSPHQPAEKRVTITTPEHRRGKDQKSPVTPRSVRADRRTPPPPPPPVIHRPVDSRTFVNEPPEYSDLPYFKSHRSKVQHHPV